VSIISWRTHVGSGRRLFWHVVVRLDANNRDDSHHREADRRDHELAGKFFVTSHFPRCLSVCEDKQVLDSNTFCDDQRDPVQMV
jgi:hypothetical protein